MLFIDSEGTPILLFSAPYVNEESGDICSVFHAHVKCLLDKDYDCDAWARRHIHGLNLNYLAKNGLMKANCCDVFVTIFTHPYRAIFANAPLKVRAFKCACT